MVSKRGMKSVLFLNRVYPPAEGATGQLLAELAAELVRSDWRVTVVTSRSNPDWSRSERVNGVQVERVNGLPFTRASHWRRALSYFSLYPALLARARKLPRADVVVTMTDPPLSLLLGPALKRLHGSRLVHWAQDLYPELAEALGVLSQGGTIAQVCRSFSTRALRRHDVVVALGRCMKQRLVERGIASERIRVVPNWAQGIPAGPVPPAENPFRRAEGWQDRFVVMYSGNLGLAHPFEAMIDAAEQVQATHPQMLFVFVGHGARLAWVKQQVLRRRLSHVQFLPAQPLENLAQTLGAADVHLASMQDNLHGLVVPSKVYGILGAARPCVFLGPESSEAAQVIRHHQCGDVVSRPSGAAVAACLTAWAEDRERWTAAVQRLTLASPAFGVAPAATAFEGVFQQLVNQETPETEPAKPSVLAAPETTAEAA
jgi:glycosyltransferase involved in cell wall biosynthesis